MNQDRPRCYSYIRFSSPDQLKGDSLRRQLQLSEDYAKKHGLILNDSFKLQDQGISAFSGEHVRSGKLGLFLEAIKNNEIPKGSILLVESLDRLSRENVFDALNQFTNIIRNGITIVTLSDGAEYSQSTIDADYGRLMLSLTIMARAHEESLQKSKRLSAAWQNKRNNISNQKITAKCTAWLTLNKDKTAFEPILERVALIKRIFELSQSGCGMNSIAITFNKERIPSWGRGVGWHSSYISKILHNRAVLGEFQPHKLNNGKREPAGEPIEKYYPQVVEESLFYDVQTRLKNNVGKGGRTGKISNLFSNLAICKYCNSSMHYVNKGGTNQYLVCDHAKRAIECIYAGFNYHHFEKAFLNFCKGLDFKEIVNSTKKESNTKLRGVKNTVLTLQGKLKECEKNAHNLLSSLENESNLDLQNFIKNRLSEVLNTKGIIEEQLKNQQLELDNLQKIKQPTANEFKNFILSMEKAEGEERINIRTKLRSEIRQIIEKIQVAPLGPLTTDQAKISSLVDDLLEDGASEEWTSLSFVDSYLLPNEAISKSCGLSCPR